MFELMDLSLTRQDFEEAFQKVEKIIREVQEGNIEEFELIRQAVTTLSTKLKGDAETTLKEAKTEMRLAMASQMEAINQKLRNIKDGADGKDGKDGRDGINGKDGKDGKDGVFSTADLTRIKKLEDDVRKQGGRIQTPAKAFRIYTKDASAQCDGITKSFTVGGTHFGIVGVFGTQFPNIYRPVIDFTETKTGILLTDQVGAPETSQTLIIQYLK